MVATEKKWQFRMLMNLVIVPNHLVHQMNLWADFVPITSRQVQQLVSSAGIDSPNIVPTEKAALAMEY